MTTSFEHRLADKYDTLSARVREAGDYVARHPVDIASRSLRAVAGESGLAPATFSRLARMLEYDSFEELREGMRRRIGRRVNSFADRAGRLQSDHGGGDTGFFNAHRDACLRNLQALSESIDPARLNAAVERLHAARRVLLFGALGSTGIAEYMAYMARMMAPQWEIAGRMGTSLGSALTGMGARDALVIVTMPPFSPKALLLAELARAQGVYVVVITDTHACPALRHADSGFLVQTESPHFFSSYVTPLFLVETMIGMLASKAGPEATARIAEVEECNRRLQEVSET
ncbi:DNA-binding transcriptional regulator, MurR/RpiR family, contains HTH and SIS domains [Salinihabitans flavidus]|uniref:DNA-binding transcriptional regulator, MurR/RpiR family, contains HTH and SIS domains n=1 Tax=Salinihabitans flavidus TaxID=569882 RepID=A0A1H8U3Q9_9RHOB|nr:MurR/RpiR family transcriptional regulator [Salinihabitans flavidus]SEO97912.1 DNA-binding transcriptional regulator, MurR/RpiR family, contains HTH and SIS domains [Salinihabitans flavidus]